MQFEPGPIPLLTPDLSSLAPEPAEFGPLEADALSEMPELEAEIDGVLNVALYYPDPPDLPLFDSYLADADAGLRDVTGFVIDTNTTNAEKNSQLMFERLNQGAGDAPAEIWYPVPPAMNIPSDTGPHPGVNGPTFVEIANVTRPGDNAYYSGDSYTITIQVQSGNGNYDFANKAVYLIETHAGVQLAPIDTGGTDTFGIAHHSGVWADGDVGAWHATTNPAGAGEVPSLNWTVNPGPAPGGPGGPPAPGGPITVTIQNLTSGDASNFHVGDSWLLIITGPPNQPVYIGPTHDGVSLAVEYLGQTSSTGILQLYGNMDPSTVGSWVEAYNVGGRLWQGQLIFTVS